jgi:hypothetical protein
MNVNQVTFCTTTALAAATVAAVIATTKVVGAVAFTAFTVLAITFAAISLASIAAWAEVGGTSEEIKKYFETTLHHRYHTVPGGYQFVAQILVQNLVLIGIGAGIGQLIARKLSTIY